VKILVSAGPTREYFDSVRYITNASSGRMGYAIAREAARAGHEVTLVSGPVALKPPPGVALVAVTTAEQMARACKRAFRQADAAVMAAAVCDERPTDPARYKNPKRSGRQRVVLESTEDIAASLGRRKGKRLLIGFAMEDHDGLQHAEAKLRKKNCDLIVLNGLDSLGGDKTVVAMFTPERGWSEPMAGTKTAIARKIVRRIEALAAGR
jgi:phosphopantothenoylcysteine decarboxylase / phosphopantothenate---cysteine ligase